MTQYAVPSADQVDGNWLDEGGSAVDLYVSIVPGTPGSIGSGDDSTYIESPGSPSAEACAFKLSTITDPGVGTGHIMRWRRGKNQALNTHDLTVQIREGYVSEASQGTLINSFADNNVPASPTTTTDTLTAGEADSISNYGNLFVRFSANQSA